MWTIPPKPDGMTYRRYWRIANQLVREINRASHLGDARLDALTSGIDTLLAKREQVRRRSGI